ncbi:NrtR DNA-binding winged helix domain-containing protein [Clostridium sp.]|uniref:NUDIX domain-containing protein n=1 Tax=Clostridium sp. TaxID=1506 RepID=UPI0039966435
MTFNSEIKNNSEEEFLKSYDESIYDKPSVTVDMVLFTVGEKQVDNKKRKNLEKELRILLVKRKNYPFKGYWAIPGGFIDINESLEASVYKKLKEETNIENVYFEQLYTWGEVNRDPRMRVISASYMALVNRNNLKEVKGERTEDIGWFTVKKELVSTKKLLPDKLESIYTLSFVNEEKGIALKYTITENKKIRDFNVEESYVIEENNESEKIAFDHVKIINYALERMQNKVQYSTIAFSLLPELFTLTELQQVYEMILGRELIKSNFRRWINPLVEETDKSRREGAHRPSKLFRLRKEAIIDGILNI